MELGVKKSTHSLFFSQECEYMDFSQVLKQTQEYISENYANLITDSDLEDAKEQMKRYIGKFVMDEKIAVKGMNENELIDALYTEMAEYGFLTKYIFGDNIEEIDINSWQDIEVQYSDGRTVKLDEHFDTPEHAVNVVRRMLHVSGMVLDNASPAVLGHLSKNIRIAALKTPLVDEDVGIAASIRIVNPQSMKKEDFVQGGTATDEMLNMLSQLVRYGISICIAGATSSGKTTVLGWLLTTIPNGKRIYTIENGSRELDLTRYENGKALNSVIHTITRDSDNDKQKIDQITLLDMALRFNPDIAVIGEMRGSEANAGQEAARTGIAVITTLHANSAASVYPRMVSLCKRAVDMDDKTLYGYVTEAYPIVVFCKQLENKQRRMMEIMECEIMPDGTRNFRSLYQYIVTENEIDKNGKFIIEGHHKRMQAISYSLAKRLLENGMPLEMINSLQKAEVSDN
ncbi:MAG: CpaF/VirB11 family protein [Anaerovorax sp.]|nr:CpaF/VirB11 family protein [Anaerovorax sp.]